MPWRAPEAAYRRAGFSPQAAHKAFAGLLSGRPWVKLLPLLIPAALLVPGISGFPYPSTSALYSDLAVSHYPNALFLRQALASWRQVPLWSPALFGGYPFAANPLSGLWYPPGWAALLLPLPLGLNLAAALHLLWGGLGMVRLLRAEGLDYPAALFGGLAFEAMPKLFAHYGAGHLTLLYAVPWTPWLLWSVSRPPAAAPRLDRVLPAIFLALTCLADVRWAPFAAALMWGYGWACGWSRGEGRRRWRSAAGALPGLAAQTLLGVALAAPLLLPLWEYSRLSTRAALQAQDFFTFSLPVGRLLGLVFPALSGFHEWMLYPGAAVLSLAMLALAWRSVRAGTGFWVAAAGLSLWFALGEALPGPALLARLPGLSLLRVPSRALFVFGMCLAVLAARAAGKLSAALGDRERYWGNLLLAGTAGFGLVLAGGAWLINGRPSPDFAWGAGAAAAAAAWTGLRLHSRLSHPAWIAGLIVLCLLDWGTVDHSLFAYRPAADVLAEGGPVVEFLARQSPPFRVFAYFPLPQQSAAAHQLELAGGVDPLQSAAYAGFLNQAAGAPASGYSVTLPPISAEDDQEGSATIASPDPDLLGLLNVRYLVTRRPLDDRDLRLRLEAGGYSLYENLAARPRAWIQPVSAPLGEELTPVQVFAWTPGRIELAVPPGGGDRLLVLSEAAYPGWQARVDGRPAQIESPAGALTGVLRGVRLPAGAHKVIFVFRPISVYAGLALNLLSASLLILWGSPTVRAGFLRRRKAGFHVPA